MASEDCHLESLDSSHWPKAPIEREKAKSQIWTVILAR